MFPKPSVLALWAAILITSSSGASDATNAACQDLEVAVPDRVSYPLSLSYGAEIRSYWSTALHEHRPACLVLPRSAQDVAAAVRVLNKHPEVKFAVKSGGHDPNPGHATAEDGVLISMKELTGTTYDDGEGLAYVKPGGEWNDVIGTLDAQGVTIPGGRLGMHPRLRRKFRADRGRSCGSWRISLAGRYLLFVCSVWPGCRCECKHACLTVTGLIV